MLRESVLITDSDQRAALACLRALGRAGHACYAVGPEKGSLAHASRYCRAHVFGPDALEAPEMFVNFLSDAAKRWNVDVLIPVTEKALRAVLPVRSVFSNVEIPFPSHQVFNRVSDKREVLEMARTLGMDVPDQWVWDSLGEVDPASVPLDAYPLAVKPTQSVSPAGGVKTTAPVTYLASPPELGKWLEKVDPGAFPVLAQQRVRGQGAGVFLLVWEGALKAVVGHRRIREKPPSGGVSVLRESTVVDPELLRQSLDLLEALGWVEGVAMVEFKMDREEGRRWLMEINGRFWGSLQLAIDAGVDFPGLLLSCARGQGPDETVFGRAGVKTRWLMGDVDQLLIRLRRSREELQVPDGFPGRGRALAEFLAGFRPGVRTEVLRLRDPGPFVRELRQWARL